MFVASSVEQLDLAYAAQEGLEFDVEVTVWTQGVFMLSRTSIHSLRDQVEESDFALFVLAPDDITKLRDKSFSTARDNVVFELGLFAGRLGIERCFMIVPRGTQDLHLPTDLLGLSPAEFDHGRTDKNLVAALGPACNRIRRSVAQLGLIKPPPAPDIAASLHISRDLLDDGVDIIAVLTQWFGSSSDGNRVIFFDEVDHRLRLKPGSARLYIERAAAAWDYEPATKGAKTITFKSVRSR